MALFVNAACTGQAVATVVATDGTFMHTYTVVANSPTTFYVEARDAAGVSSPCSAGFTYVHDNERPDAPTVTTTVPALTGNTLTPRVDGNAEPDSTVRIYTNESCSGPGLAEGPAGEGAFAITMPMDLMPNATTTFYARTIDRAGNTSECSTPGVPYLHDGNPPAAPTIDSTSPPERSNSDTEPEVVGTSESGSMVTVYATGDCTGAIAGSMVATGETFSITATVLNETLTFSALATDAAGNPSECSNTITFTHDAMRPLPPELLGTNPTSPSKTNLNPYIVGNAEPGSTVRLHLASDCSDASIVPANATTGEFSIQVTASANSSVTFYATATDATSNISPCSDGIEYIHDDRAPPTPEFGEPIPLSPSPDETPMLTGTAEAASRVDIYALSNCGGAVVTFTYAASDDSFGVTVTAGANTTTTFSAKSIDAATNTSNCSADLAYRHDSVEPDPPVLDPLASPGNINTIMISGTAETDARVRVYRVALDTELVGEVTATNGTFSISDSVTDDSTTDYFALAVDAAGNPSTPSGLVTYVEDSTRPDPPQLVSIAPSSPASDASPMVGGIAEASSTLTFYALAGCQGSVITTGEDSPAAFDIVVSVTSNTANDLSATATDAAGNVSLCSNDLSYVHDDFPPLFAGVASAVTDSPTQVSLSWLAASDSAPGDLFYDICQSATRLGCATTFTVIATAGPGATSASMSGLQSDTRYYFVVRARDAAGNTDSNVVEATTKTTGTRSASHVAPGRDHTCALMSTGRVQCWGRNDVGQLGDGSTTPRSVPAPVSGLQEVRSVGVGRSHSCALGVDGRVWCWGALATGLGDSGHTLSSTAPIEVDPLANITAMAVAVSHTCALRVDGAVFCWGDNTYGQVGPAGTSEPVQVPGVSGVIALDAGEFSTCALLDDRSAVCWGRNDHGQLGNGTTNPALGAVAVSSLAGATAISVGGLHACALLATGGVSCWGYNSEGQLGDASTVDSSVPVAAQVGALVRSISVGAAHSCAVLADGTARCWGRGAEGQLGFGDFGQRDPVAVSGIAHVVRIDAGESHTCVVLAGETARCFGLNADGQLGAGGTQNQAAPVAVAGLVDVASVVRVRAGEDTGCAVLSDGTARCWGANNYGQIDNGTGTLRRWPVVVPGVANLLDVFPGRHTCAVVADGAVQCWGKNADGELGDGSVSAPRATPQPVLGLTTGVVSVAIGYAHTCALKADGTVWCWGKNAEGELGQGGTDTADRSSPAQVPGLSGAVAISAGWNFTCALLSTGGAVCWGRDTVSQLGDEVYAQFKTAPVAVSGLSGAIALASGTAHTCAPRSDGTAWCWGFNDWGALGNGNNTRQDLAVQVVNLVDAVSVATGNQHTCASRANGRAQCWGYDWDGQLGNETDLLYFNTPQDVQALSNVMSVAAGANSSCAHLADGSASCWGKNDFGQVGNGAGPNRYYAPVPVISLP